MPNLSEILFQLGEDGELSSSPVTPPIYQTSNFYFPKVSDLRKAFTNEFRTHIYTRGNNPTVEILRKKLAALAGAEDALVVSSGAAAMSIAVLAQVKTGDHIVCVKNPYSWTEKLSRIILQRFGVETSFVDAGASDAIIAAVQSNTALIILESPNTFTFEVQNVKQIADFAKSNGITTIIDNTYSTPIGQRCIEMGIDIEVHSASKYINGHSDVIAGVVIGSSTKISSIFQSEFMNLGVNISPHDAWLILRGLRTLPVRMRQIGESTQQVIAYLKSAHWVEKVNHPFEGDATKVDLAKSQMQWYGGLFSVYVKSDAIAAIEAFCEQLRFFKMAVSWGGHESLVMPACAFYDSDYSGMRKYPANLIRFSIGLEDANVLIGDMQQSAVVFVK